MSKKLNFCLQLEEAIERIKVDRDVRAVILKSDVPGIFCAGADLKERAKMKEEEVGPFVARARGLISNVSTLPMPVITALDGGAFGGGLELALATDIRIAGMINNVLYPSSFTAPTLFYMYRRHLVGISDIGNFEFQGLFQDNLSSVKVYGATWHKL